MRDQASALREASRSASSRFNEEPAEGRVFVVGSGKGGVGKSIIAASLAAALHRDGRRVLLVDACQEQPNLHVILGVRPRGDIWNVMSGTIAPRDLLVDIEEGLRLLPAHSVEEALAPHSATDRARLHLRLTALYDDFDAVVVDAGPGIEATLRATLRAGRLVVVAVPEPASLSDAYALIKTASLRTPDLPVDLLVNCAGSEEEARNTYQVIRLAAERFLQRRPGYLGGVAEDPAMRRAARTPGAVLSAAPDSIRTIAREILSVHADHSARKRAADGVR